MRDLNISDETVSDLRAVAIEENKARPEAVVDVEDILKDWIEHYWVSR